MKMFERAPLMISDRFWIVITQHQTDCGMYWQKAVGRKLVATYGFHRETTVSVNMLLRMFLGQQANRSFQNSFLY